MGLCSIGHRPNCSLSSVDGDASYLLLPALFLSVERGAGRGAPREVRGGVNGDLGGRRSDTAMPGKLIGREIDRRTVVTVTAAHAGVYIVIDRLQLSC